MHGRSSTGKTLQTRNAATHSCATTHLHELSQSVCSSCVYLVFGFVLPHESVQVDSEGKKIGKSEAGAVWLAPDKLSPYKFYQYLFATTDADVVRFLKMLTFLPLEEIATVEAAMSEPGYAPNTAQKLLAQEVTRFVHGEEGLEVRCCA